MTTGLSRLVTGSVKLHTGFSSAGMESSKQKARRRRVQSLLGRGPAPPAQPLRVKGRPSRRLTCCVTSPDLDGVAVRPPPGPELVALLLILPH